MTKNNIDITEILEKRYKKVVDQDLKTDAIIEGKRELFTGNLETIDGSIKKSLKNVGENKVIIQNHFKSLLKDLKGVFNDQIKALDEEKQTLNHNHSVYVSDAEEMYTQNEKLAEMKLEKATKNYHFKIKQASNTYKTIQTDAEAVIEEALSKHNTHMTELLENTTQRQEDIKTIESTANAEFNKQHKTITSKKTKALNELNQEKTATLESIKKSITALKRTYRTNLKPIDDELEALKKKQQRAMNKLLKDQEKEINKQESYKNEAEKINDSSNVSYHEKKIKQLSKAHATAIKEMEKEHAESLEPELQKRVTFIEETKETFLEKKKEAVQQVLMLLSKTEDIQYEHIVEIDTANTELNKELARYQKEKTAIDIEHRIQNLNYDQSIEETTQLKEDEKKCAEPQYELEEKETKLHYDLEAIEISAQRKINQADHQKQMDTLLKKHTYNLEKVSNLSNRLHYFYEYDRDTIHALKEDKLIRLDFNHENMLMSHFLRHTENYSALKNESVLDKKPALQKEIDNRMKLKISTYKSMIKQAEADHEIMLEKIENAYEEERKIYEAPLEQMRKDHQRIIDNLVAVHANERNEILDTMDKLDETKNKKEILKLKKELNIRQHEQDEELSIKKTKLKEERSANENILKFLEKNKQQSIEEAETLLYHHTDQLNLAIEEAKQQAKEELNLFMDHYYEIKHRSQLFKTFQRNRKARTMHKATSYLNDRLNDLKHQQQKSDNLLKEQITNLEHALTRKETVLKENIETIEQTYQKTLSDIQKTKEAEIQSVNQAYEESKNKIILLKQKLEKQQAQQLKKQKDSFENQKQALFDEKDNNEAEYTQQIKQLDDSLQEEISNKQAQLNKDKTDLKQRADTIIDQIKEEPIERLNETDVPRIEAILKGEDTL